MLDRVWRRYEHRLPWAIDSVSAVPETILDAHAWIILIEAVAGLIVRTPDYADRDVAGLKAFFGDDLPDGLHSDNANIKRLMDYQWLTSTLLFCEWTILRIDTPVLVTNDNGFCLGPDLRQRPAAVVPLRPGLALVVSRGPGNLRGWWDGQTWRIEGFNVVDVEQEATNRLNGAIVSSARHEVYGAVEASVVHAAELWRSRPDRTIAPPPQLLYGTPERRMTIEHQFNIARGLLAEPPRMKPPWLLRFDGTYPWAESNESGTPQIV